MRAIRARPPITPPIMAPMGGLSLLGWVPLPVVEFEFGFMLEVGGADVADWGTAFEVMDFGLALLLGVAGTEVLTPLMSKKSRTRGIWLLVPW
jgi:hypothetical protein